MQKMKNNNMASELKIECDESGVGAAAPPLSPLSKIYVRHSNPKSEEIMHCAMSFRDPIDVEALKKEVSNSLLTKHPRFCSLLIRDNTGEHWITTRVNVDDHIIVHHTTAMSLLEDNNDDDEDGVNSFLAEISVSTPLSKNKPLWEMHVLLGLKCVVLSVHHALGDGVSFMSLIIACFTKKSDDNSNKAVDYSKMKNSHNHTPNAKNNIKGDKRTKKGLWWLVKSLCLTLVNLLRFLGRFLWVKDQRSVLSDHNGVELGPRKLATAMFLLEDFKSIKTVIPQVTVNDVLLGVISSGLSKYLKTKSPLASKQACQLTAFLPINVRKEPYIQEISDLMLVNSKGLSGWGNKTSCMLLPIHCCNDLHPLDHVRAIKAIMDKKKRYSLEAYLIFQIGVFIAKFFTVKIVGLCFRRAMANTTLCISNVGRMEEIVIADNPVTHMRIGVSSIPQAIGVYMISYAGKVFLQVTVAKDSIPDPEVLVNFFQKSFLEIKNSIIINDNNIM